MRNTRTLGIILAGGRSTRLYPATLSVTKQLLPIYDKPLIYYPLSLLMLAGIKDIITITTSKELKSFETLYRKSNFLYALNCPVIPQFRANGIPEAFNLVSEEFSKNWIDKFDRIVLILGDNIFHGATITGTLKKGLVMENCVIFGQRVPDLHRFGVATLKDDKIKTIVEKPSKIEDVKNSYAVTGLYVFPKSVFQQVKTLKPSERGETEIVDLINIYHQQNELDIEILKRGVSWFDTGTPDSLLDAAHYVKTIQTNQGFLVGSPHEVAYNNGWLNKEQILKYADLSEKSSYSQKLLQLIEENND